jgi:hypothetical protein
VDGLSQLAVSSYKVINKAKKKMTALKDEKLNHLKMIEITTYYSKQYDAQKRLMQIVAVLGICLFLSMYFQIKPLTTLILIVGIIWGLAFYIRIHIAILIGVFILWDLIIKKQKLSYYFPFGIGFLISTCIEIASNYWLYGDLIWSPYGYFYSNVIDGAANSFGIQPVYFYFSELIKKILAHSKNLFPELIQLTPNKLWSSFQATYFPN